MSLSPLPRFVVFFPPATSTARALGPELEELLGRLCTRTWDRTLGKTGCAHLKPTLHRIDFSLNSFLVDAPLVPSPGCDGEAAPGSWCRSECAPHYHRGPASSDGANVTSTCLEDGGWDAVPEPCIAQQVCLPAPAAPEHGETAGGCGGLLGDVCEYRCDGGFLLVGPPIAVCAVAAQDEGTSNPTLGSQTTVPFGRPDGGVVCRAGHWFEGHRNLSLDDHDIDLTCSEASLSTHLPTYPPTHLPTYPPTHLPTYPPRIAETPRPPPPFVGGN